VPTSPEPPQPPAPPANEPASVVISGLPSSVVVGDTFQLSATVRNAQGAVVQGAAVTWSSLDAARLQSTGGGRFVSLGDGPAGIRAQAGSAADTASVAAEPRVITTLMASVGAPLFLTGDQEVVAVEARDQRGRALPEPTLDWSSSAPGVATVSASGQVDALAPGEATVTVQPAGGAQGAPSVALQLRVVPGDGPRIPELLHIDSLVTTWMEANQVPGVQVAIMREGRLVLSRGYGVRDATLPDPVTEGALFRIGSLSKPMAGLAFLQAVERGEVTLDDRLFEALLEVAPPLPGQSVDPRLAQVTAREALRHLTGYGDRTVDDRVYAGVWQAGATDPLQVFRHGLGHPLAHDPGTTYTYTNFNTQAVARYLELVTGAPFEEHVRQTLMAPAGVTRMVYGKGPMAERDPAEVRYHHTDGQPSSTIDQGRFAMTYYDASGSWIGSATDLMRILRAVEGSGGSEPLLSEASLQEISNRTPEAGGSATSFYGLHWLVTLQGSVTNWSHTGAAQGAWARIYRSSSGTSYAILTNRAFGGTLDLRLAAPLQGVSWPGHDLFDR